MNKNKTMDIILSALGAALIAVCAWLVIPGDVPITMQTFAVYLVLCLFGAKTGLRAIVIYIIIGAIGIPVFSGFGAGIGVLLGTTGGYIIGFVFIGVLYEVFAGRMT
ncbi:MAG: biotin transporter BioY, partial [Clostridia bacterium]|nr:biotin transporter BioY [Clostridia bacterium]